MFLNKNILYTFYSHFLDIYTLGFDEKKTLDSLFFLYPNYQNIIKRLQHQLQAGTSVYNAIESLNTKPSTFTLHLPSFNLAAWLDYKITDYNQKKILIDQFIKACGGPCLLLLGSCLLNVLFITIFIPQTQHMLTQFNIEAPFWLTYLDSINFFLKQYGIFFVLCSAVFLLLTQKYIFKLGLYIKYRLSFELEKKTFFQLLICLLKNNTDIKDIATAIRCHQRSRLAKHVDLFCQHIIKHHSYRQAFCAIEKNPHYLDIILQSIATNQLAIGLSQVVKLYTLNIEKKISRATTIVKFSAFCITGIQIAIGFYISMLPMNQLLRRVIEL